MAKTFSTLSNKQISALTGAPQSVLTTQQFNWNASNSITLGGNIPAINIGDLLKNYDPNHIKKYEILETNADSLALSVAHKRIISDKNYRGQVSIRNILDSGVFSEITDADRETANKIRTYYSHQLVVWALKEIKITKFRECLGYYINGDGSKFKEDYIPIIAKLPYFYEYDIQLDEIKRSIETDIDIDNSVQLTKHELIPIKSLIRKNKRIKCIEYWLKDVNNYAYKIQIEINNPLQHLWDNIFKEGLKITGIGVPKRRDDFKYYQLLNWSSAS